MELIISKRADKYTLYKRELDISKELAIGTDLATMYIKLAEKYNVSEKTIQRDYYRVVNRISEERNDKKDEIRARILQRIELIAKTAFSEGKYKPALDATLALAKLTGIDKEEEQKNNRPEIINLVQKDFQNKLKVVAGDESGE